MMTNKNTRVLGVVAACTTLFAGCASEPSEMPPAATETTGAETTTVEVTAEPAAATSPAPGKTTAELVQRYNECWGYLNTKAMDSFAGCYAARFDSDWLDSGMPALHTPAELVEQRIKPMTTAFPDFNGQLQLTLANGKNVASLAITRGTHQGVLQSPMGAIQPTGRRIGILSAHGVTLNDVPVAEKEWFAQDAGTMMAQLGLSPAPARAVIDKDWAVRPVVIATGDAKEAANVQAATTLYARFNANDPTAADLIADDVVDYNHSFAQDVVGKPALLGMLDGLKKGFSDLKFEAKSVWGAGDYTVAHLTITGTNNGAVPAFGIAAPTNKPVKLQMIEFVQWKDGKAIALWPVFNSAAMAAQLGLVPPPSAADAKAAPAKKIATAKAEKKK